MIAIFSVFSFSQWAGGWKPVAVRLLQPIDGNLVISNFQMQKNWRELRFGRLGPRLYIFFIGSGRNHILLSGESRFPLECSYDYEYSSRRFRSGSVLMPLR